MQYGWTSHGGLAYKLIFMNISTDTTPANAVSSLQASNAVMLPTRHLLGIEGMNPLEIRSLLDRGDQFADCLLYTSPSPRD